MAKRTWKTMIFSLLHSILCFMLFKVQKMDTLQSGFYNFSKIFCIHVMFYCNDRLYLDKRAP